MNIMELGAIGELVGGVAVVTTLLYLAIQVRRHALELRASSAQAYTDSLNNINFLHGASVGTRGFCAEGVRITTA